MTPTFFSRMRRLRHLLVAGGALACAGAAMAAYPERVITMVVPYAPGGAADALARVVATRMGDKLGTTIVIDNRAGASGTLGAGHVAKAPADGYTVLYDATPFAINPHLFKMRFEPSELRPVSLVAQTPNLLIVRQDSPFKDVKDLIAQAQAQPAKITFASGGAGTVQRLAAELFRQRLNLDMVHVPYKSGAPAITDVVGGHVEFMFGTVTATSPLVTSGKLRALAVTSPKRSAVLPAVPTVGEQAIPGFEVYEWNGVFVPAKTPPEIVARLQQALAASLEEPDVKRRFEELGALPIGSTPEAFAEYLKKEDARWGEVIRKGNIKLD